MTRAVVFLAMAMAAASLGVAQDTSGTTQNSSQSNTDNSAQHSIAAANAQQSTGSTPSTAVSNGQNSTNSPATRNSSDQTVARSEVSPDTANGQLPQTSTILPLLGLIGLGSLVAGFFARH
jgi:hypothetical protein